MEHGRGIANSTFPTRVCTPIYSAPEMMFAPWQKGPESCYGARVDTWSLGAIAYELCSGNYLAFAPSDARIVSHWVAL